jgi:hypothetical protein
MSECSTKPSPEHKRKVAPSTAGRWVASQGILRELELELQTLDPDDTLSTIIKLY